MKILHVLFVLLISSYAFCQYDSIRPQGIYSSNFIIDEKPRNITYYMPRRYGKEELYPLLIVLHDEKSNAKGLIKKYGDIVQAKADSVNAIVLYPDAFEGHWNDKAGTSVKDSANDVGFISIMLEFFVRQFNCDVGHVYLIGIGSGGNVCYRFTCESAYKPAAIASLNATVDEHYNTNCSHPETIPAISIKIAVIAKPDILKALSFVFSQPKPE